MDYLTTLPTEVVDIIISNLLSQYLHHSFPRNCLLDLSLVSRRLNNLTNPFLYHSVYYSSSNDEAPAGPGETYDGEPYIPPTRIFHLRYFSRTLESSFAFRSLVKHVDISWSTEAWTPFTEQRVVHILRLLNTSSKSMHLGPPDPSFSIPASLPLTSLSLVYDGSGPANSFNTCTLTSLHAICAIPTLRQLSLSNWRLWDVGPTMGAPKPRSSSITHLSLYQSRCPGPCLREVLTWPKALESFVFQSFPYATFYTAEHRLYSPVGLLDCLRPHQETLRSLFLIINSNKWEANSTHSGDGTTLRDFSDFIQLKRLCVSRELLGFPSSVGFPRQAFEIQVALPTNIEQFHVDIQFSGSWDQLKFMDKNLSEPLAQGVFGVLDCLQHIAKNKSVGTPQLKKIVVYYGTYTKERRLISVDRAIPSGQSECAKLLEKASNAAGIGLVFWTNWRRPLWQDWLSPYGLREFLP